MTRLARLRRRLEELFPERHLYIRTGGATNGIVLSTGRQMAAAAAAAAVVLWAVLATVALVVGAFTQSASDREVARTEAKYERWIADRQARLNSAVAQLNATEGSIGAAVASVEKRHAALALLLSEVGDAPGPGEPLAPALNRSLAHDDVAPLRRVELVRLSQEKLLEATDAYAKGRGERLRLAFRLAGLTPSAFMSRGDDLGGPLIEGKDPRALAVVLDVDEDFAARIRRTAEGLSETRALDQAAQKLPVARPTEGTPRSSGFGVRLDPFTGRPAFHSGLDFSGSYFTPVLATGPGVVSYTGVRSGYGNTIEIDHGRGLKTRYAHLQAIGVRPGQRVAVGQRVGAMGSTGRSTGPHLHYEVWVNGRAKNPDRFVKAGEYVHQGS
jgi:murein DD-endopeptidase MepM/ murein hydrolase activator NlpD